MMGTFVPIITEPFEFNDPEFPWDAESALDYAGSSSATLLPDGVEQWHRDHGYAFCPHEQVTEYEEDENGVQIFTIAFGCEFDDPRIATLFKLTFG